MGSGTPTGGSKTSSTARWAWIAAAGTGVMAGVQFLYGPPGTPAAPWRIISFELAGDARTAQEILRSWGDEGRQRATISLFLDYGYILCYAFLLWWLCRWAASILTQRDAAVPAVLAIVKRHLSGPAFRRGQGVTIPCPSSSS